MAQTKDKKNWPCGPLSRNHSPVGTARERCKVLKRSGFSSCSCNDTLIMYFKSNYSHMTHILIAIVWLCFLPFLVLQWFKFVNISLLVSHNTFVAFLIEYQAPSVTVLYTAPHDLLDSVGLIWSPNVTKCHMVGPVDSAGFRWSKCWLLSTERGPVEPTGLCSTGLF